MLVSLGLITVYFREANDGPLHAAQRIGVSVLMPFEVAGERVARPFRDSWAWMSDLLDAKDENEELRQENEDLRREVIEARSAARELELQGTIAAYISGPRFPEDFEPVVARIIGRPPDALPAGSDRLGGLGRRHPQERAGRVGGRQPRGQGHRRDRLERLGSP